jgi:hypothetical protein
MRRVPLGVALTLLALVSTTCLLPPPRSLASTPPHKSPQPVLISQVGQSQVLYVLWTRNCANDRSCYALERSDDGGETFTQVSAPPISFQRDNQGGPLYQLNFANANDGLAVVQSTTAAASLWATFNGGDSWQRDVVGPGQRVGTVASTSTSFYAVTSNCAVGANRSCGDGHLDRSPATTIRWTAHPLPIGRTDGAALPNVTAYANDVWLTTDEQVKPYKSLLATSYNDGATFAVRPKPLLSSQIESGLTATSTVTLWGVSDQGMMHGDIVFSHDGGATWSYGHGGVSEFGFGTFDPMSAFGAVFVNYTDGNPHQDVQLLPTASSRAVPLGRTPSSWITQLAFVTPMQGLALGQSGGGFYTLYETSDGAKRWSVSQLAK